MADVTINFDNLNALLSKVNLDPITADSSGGYEELKDGYYLSEVEKAELTVSKNSGNPQVAMTFKIVEDGIGSYIDERGYQKFSKIEHTKNRKIFKYYPLATEKDVNRFVSDMLKFEGDTPGEPILPKEAFTTGETIEEAVDALVGFRIYVQASTTIKKGTEEKQTWYNLISWNRATQFNLPTE